MVRKSCLVCRSARALGAIVSNSQNEQLRYVLMGSYTLHMLGGKAPRQHVTWVRCIAQLRVCV